MIQRRRDYGKREPSRDAHKIYLVCEGKDTELNYFKFFEGLSSNLQVIAIPPTVGTDPIKLMKRAQEVLLDDKCGRISCPIDLSQLSKISSRQDCTIFIVPILIPS